MRQANVTFELFVNGVSVGNERGFLKEDWKKGRSAGEGDPERAWTHVLKVPLSSQIRDDWPSGLDGSERIVIGDEELWIVFVERERSLRGDEYLRAFLREDKMSVIVREVDGTPSVVATVIELHQDDGFVVTDQGGGVARITLGGIDNSDLFGVTATAGLITAATSMPSASDVGAPASNDRIPIYDASALGWKYVLPGALSGGEVNTASNLGAGVGVFEGKSGVDLQFNSIVGADGVSVTEDDGNDEIDVTLDVNGLTEDTSPSAADDFLVTYDASASVHKKVQIDTLIPVGTIWMHGASSVPTGWLACDGAEVSRSVYANLFAVIGTTWGSGNGSTTFNVPDLRGRSPLGVGTGSGLTARSLADTGGEETHALTVAEMAAHSHDTKIKTGNWGFTSGAGIYAVGGAGGQTTDTVGSGDAHETMHPFAAVTFMIKT